MRLPRTRAPRRSREGRHDRDRAGSLGDPRDRRHQPAVPRRDGRGGGGPDRGRGEPGRERAATYAAEHGIPRSHGSYEALLADREIDAVYISLPNTSITRGRGSAQGRQARPGGEAVHPAAGRGRRGVRRRRSRRALLVEGFMWRYTPQTERLVEESRRIGALRTIRSTFSFRLDDETNIRLRPEVEGGSLMDVGCYCVSAARLLAGEEPVEVAAIAGDRPDRRRRPVHRDPSLPVGRRRRVHVGVRERPPVDRGHRVRGSLA